jgi:hypothetical protein
VLALLLLLLLLLALLLLTRSTHLVVRIALMNSYSAG